jgi:hypothetical protein
MIRRFRVSLLFGALALALFWRVFFLGETLIASDFLAASPVWKNPPGPVANPWMSDTAEYYYPAERLQSEHARRLALPLSNPLVFNGTPIPHGVHVWNSVWPVKLAFLWLFDPVRSYDFFAIFHWWLAGVAMAAFLRSLGLGPFAAFAGALAYALSGRAMLWLHGHYLMPVMAYTPLLFLWASRRSPLSALAAAGLFFTNPHLGIAVGAAVILYERSAWKAVLSGILMAGVALVPLAAAVLGGVREPVAEAGWFYRDRWGSWLLLLGLVAPEVRVGSMEPNEWNAYVGLLPLAGALAAFRRDRYFAALGGIALAVATFYPIPVWISGFSFSLPTRYLFFVAFAAAVLFARALENRPLPAWAQAAVVALVLVDLGPRFLAWNRTYDPTPLGERPAAAAFLRGRTGWILADHAQLPRPVTPPLTLLGIPSVQGYDVMVPKVHAEAIRGAAVVGGGRTVRILDPDHPALEALGMRYLVTDRPIETRRFRLIHEGTVRIYENPAAPDVPPRPVSKTPLWIGLAFTLAGCALALAGALRGRVALTPPGGRDIVEP